MALLLQMEKETDQVNLYTVPKEKAFFLCCISFCPGDPESKLARSWKRQLLKSGFICVLGRALITKEEMLCLYTPDVMQDFLVCLSRHQEPLMKINYLKWELVLIVQQSLILTFPARDLLESVSSLQVMTI